MKWDNGAVRINRMCVLSMLCLGWQVAVLEFPCAWLAGTCGLRCGIAFSGEVYFSRKSFFSQSLFSWVFATTRHQVQVHTDTCVGLGWLCVSREQGKGGALLAGSARITHNVCNCTAMSHGTHRDSVVLPAHNISPYTTLVVVIIIIN